tara:strand:+ start:251 stop:1153 length:903 start_codon:yes stop_codon:yes gene_type:complete
MRADDEKKPRLVISFSGGRTSAVMLKMCLDKYSDTHDIAITFANTGCEHPDTLRFVDDVDRHFCRPMGYRVIWLEAIIHGPGKGPTARVVNYDTACRDGSVFEAAIVKHGVFNKVNPACTSRLKVSPMEEYIRRQIGWKRDTYHTAIGIRADEIDRVSGKRIENRLVYPLADAGWRKRDVNEFMARFDWDLSLPGDHHGNCTWCWKKSKRKLMTLAKEDPSIFDFPDRMEKKHGHINKGKFTGRNVFFRENRSAQDILRLAKTETFTPYEDDTFDQAEMFSPEWDTGSGCGESCEIGADE